VARLWRTFLLPSLGAVPSASRSAPLPTFASRFERALADGDDRAALDIAAERPGELARALDRLFRSSPTPEPILDRFPTVVRGVATPVLLQLAAHLENRAQPLESRPRLRTFLPKGQTSKVWVRAEDRDPLPTPVAERAAAIAHDELRRRFSSLDPLGACYLDPLLSDYPVPLTHRSASRSFRTVARGSRLPLPPGPIIRLFLWWKNGRSRTDIDLSAAFFDSGFRYVDVVSYYSLTSWGAVHSGDIVESAAADFDDDELASESLNPAECFDEYFRFANRFVHVGSDVVDLK